MQPLPTVLTRNDDDFRLTKVNLYTEKVDSMERNKTKQTSNALCMETIPDLESESDSKALPEEIDKALLGVIMRRGSQCLSQASLRTGFGIAVLAKAKDRLMDRGLIRIRPDSAGRDPLQVSFELDV